MNTITEFKDARKTLVKMLESYTPYEGKNLNRYKNTPEIDDLYKYMKESEERLHFNGSLDLVVIDHQNVDLSELRDRIKEVEESIHSIDLFESSYIEEYKQNKEEIKRLVALQNKIKVKFKNLPSYILDDLVDNK